MRYLIILALIVINANSLLGLSVIRVNSLKKLTVGPDDNYQGVLVPGNTAQLVFTRLSALAPKVYIYDFQSDNVISINNERYDAKDPAVSPDGKTVAFIYYKHSSRGDLCYRRFEDLNAIKCVHSRDLAASEPFWFNDDELGFVRRHFVSGKEEIIKYNIKTSSQKIVYNGKAVSPKYDRHSNSLFFSGYSLANMGGAATKNNIGSDKIRQLIQFNLSTNKKQVIEFELPGLTAFPSIAPDGKKLYFTQFYNDTNGDTVIDGSDNGTIFSMDLPIKKRGFPFPLTSTKNNCSYPHATTEKVILTCSFEGSLDIYEVDNTGIIPPDWSIARLEEYLQRLRTYDDRVFILQALIAKYSAKGEKQKVRNLKSELIGNFLIEKNYSGSLYYIDNLLADKPAVSGDRRFWSMLRDYSELMIAVKLLPKGQITTGFQSLSRKLKMRYKGSRSLLAKIILGKIALTDKQGKPSFGRLIKSSVSKPIEYAIFFELMRSAGENSIPNGFYEAAINDSVTDKQSKIYYLNAIMDNLETMPERQRLANLQGLNKRIKIDYLNTLIDSEILALEILISDSDETKKEKYKNLSKLQVDSRKDYFLIRSVYSRGIDVFLDASDYKYSGFVANTWLSNTKNKDTEYAFARDQYIVNNLDKAYGKLAEDNERAAFDLFYNGVLYTDNLESHFGYLKLAVKQNKIDKTKENYAKLKERGKINQTYTYMQAVLPTLSGKVDGDDAKAFIDQLKKMDLSKSESALKHLLIGYYYLSLFNQSIDGFDSDRHTFEQANRHLMLALDLGDHNNRILASALDNLGTLHSLAKNYGLASGFLGRRYEMPFTSNSEKIDLLLAYLKTLYYNREYAKAVEVIDKAINDESLSKDLKKRALTSPFLEKTAYYSMLASQFDQCIGRYAKLLKDKNLKLENKSKALINAGYCSLRKGEKENAKKYVLAGYQEIPRLSPRTSKDNEVIKFKVKRLELIALGLLAQAETQKSQRSMYLDKRIKLLDEMSRDAKEYYGSESSMLREKVKASLQKVGNLRENDQAAVQALIGTLPMAKKLGESAGNLNDTGVVQTIENTLAHMIANPDVWKGKDKFYEDLGDFLKQYNEVFLDVKENQHKLFFDRLKINLLHLAARHRVGKLGASEYAAAKVDLFRTDYASRLDESMPAEMKMIKFLPL